MRLDDDQVLLIIFQLFLKFILVFLELNPIFWKALESFP